jgi:hypothetical protein
MPFTLRVLPFVLLTLGCLSSLAAACSDAPRYRSDAGGTVAARDRPTSCHQEVPASGAARIAWARQRLDGCRVKFEFTQGYPFRADAALRRPFLERVKEAGFTAFDQMPTTAEHGPVLWDAEQLASLEQTLAVAADVGLDVWATIMPPTGDPALRRMSADEQREYFCHTAEQFARLATKYPNFQAFSCDDFSHNLRLFSPDMLAEMTERYRAICPRLLFVPLWYQPPLIERMFRPRAAYQDGVVFHFRAESRPESFNETDFDAYASVMRAELTAVRGVVGEHALICGIYLGYYERGWGVATEVNLRRAGADDRYPAVEHTLRDARLKVSVARELSDGLRVYGLGIERKPYAAIRPLLLDWPQGADQ